MQASTVKKVVGSAAHLNRMALRASRYGCVRCAKRLSSALLSALGLRPAVSAAAAAGSPICSTQHDRVEAASLQAQLPSPWG